MIQRLVLLAACAVATSGLLASDRRSAGAVAGTDRSDTSSQPPSRSYQAPGASVQIAPLSGSAPASAAAPTPRMTAPPVSAARTAPAVERVQPAARPVPAARETAAPTLTPRFSRDGGNATRSSRLTDDTSDGAATTRERAARERTAAAGRTVTAPTVADRPRTVDHRTEAPAGNSTSDLLRQRRVTASTDTPRSQTADSGGRPHLDVQTRTPATVTIRGDGERTGSVRAQTADSGGRPHLDVQTRTPATVTTRADGERTAGSARRGGDEAAAHRSVSRAPAATGLRHEPMDGRSDSFRDAAYSVRATAQSDGRRYETRHQTRTPDVAVRTEIIGAGPSRASRPEGLRTIDDRDRSRRSYADDRAPAVYRPLHDRTPYREPCVPVSGWSFFWQGDAFSFYASSYSSRRIYSSWGCGWDSTCARVPAWSVYGGSWRRCHPTTFAYVWNPWPIYSSYYLYDYEPAPVVQTEVVYVVPSTTAVVQPIQTASVVTASEPAAAATAPAAQENAATAAEYGAALPSYQIPEDLFRLDFTSYSETLDSGAIWASYAALDRQADESEAHYLDQETAAQNP